MLDHDVRFVDPTRINRRFEGISQRVEAGVLCDSDASDERSSAGRSSSVGLTVRSGIVGL